MKDAFLLFRLRFSLCFLFYEPMLVVVQNIKMSVFVAFCFLFDIPVGDASFCGVCIGKYVNLDILTALLVLISSI